MSFTPRSTAPSLSVVPDDGPTGVLVSLSARREAATAESAPLSIDCAECVHQHTSVCDDCVVSFIVDRSPEDAVIIDADEARAVRLLEQAGLVPGNRHTHQAS